VVRIVAFVGLLAFLGSWAIGAYMSIYLISTSPLVFWVLGLIGGGGLVIFMFRLALAGVYDDPKWP